MKWWHWLILELLIIFGVMAWIYFFPSDFEVDFAKGMIGFVLIYAIEKCRDINRRKTMTKDELKDEGIVKPLKDSIFRNERLSSQEQQELCAWIECAMDFGENLDECAEKLTEAKELLKRWVDDKVYTVSEQKDLIADTEQFLNGEVEK